MIYYLIPEQNISHRLVNLSVSFYISELRYVQDKNNNTLKYYIIEVDEKFRSHDELLDLHGYRSNEMLTLLDSMYEDVVLAE